MLGEPLRPCGGVGSPVCARIARDPMDEQSRRRTRTQARRRGYAMALRADEVCISHFDSVPLLMPLLVVVARPPLAPYDKTSASFQLVRIWGSLSACACRLRAVRVRRLGWPPHTHCPRSDGYSTLRTKADEDQDGPMRVMMIKTVGSQSGRGVHIPFYSIHVCSLFALSWQRASGWATLGLM